MLYSFKLKDYLSFKNELNFTMNSDREDVNICKVSVIFGANGCGKTNLLKAFQSFKYDVLLSQNNETNCECGIVLDNDHIHYIINGEDYVLQDEEDKLYIGQNDLMDLEYNDHDQVYEYLKKMNIIFEPIYNNMEVEEYEDKIKKFLKYVDIGEIDLYNESKMSNGTKKLISILPSILKVLQNGGLLLIDDMDSFLHPRIINFIISLFKRGKTNIGNGQLIFTAHNTSIMDYGTTHYSKLDVEEIWLMEKNHKTSETELFSLCDFDDIKNNGRYFSNDYLNGKFGGGVPFIDNSVLWFGEWEWE